MLVSLDILFVLLEQVNRRHAKDNYLHFNCVCLFQLYYNIQDVKASIPILHSSLFVSYAHVMMLVSKQETLESMLIRDSMNPPRGSTVVQCLALSPHSKKAGPGAFLHGVFMFSLCLLGFPLGAPSLQTQADMLELCFVLG